MLDGFFRRGDTWLARLLRAVSPPAGRAYATAPAKRLLDLAVVVPLVIAAIAIILVLVLVNKVLTPGRSALFLQERVGQRGGTMRIVKIRSMIARSNPETDEETPICTAFGRIIRRYYLDELPQVIQVLTGHLSLVGIRVLPREVYDGLAARWSSERFGAWQSAYATAPLGLTGVHQVFRGGGKNDVSRFHRDLFYARHASLGFDLYLLWCTLGTGDHEHDRVPHRHLPYPAPGRLSAADQMVAVRAH